MSTSPQALNILAYQAALIQMGIDPLDAIAFMTVLVMGDIEKEDYEVFVDAYQDALNKTKPPQDAMDRARSIYINMLDEFQGMEGGEV